MSFIDYMLFGSTFQFLIEEKKKDEEFTPLMFGTTKVKWLDLMLYPWCSSTFLYCLLYMLDTYCCIFYVHVITFIALLYFKYLEIKHLIVLVGKHWIYDVSFFIINLTFCSGQSEVLVEHWSFVTPIFSRCYSRYNGFSLTTRNSWLGSFLLSRKSWYESQALEYRIKWDIYTHIYPGIYPIGRCCWNVATCKGNVLNGKIENLFCRTLSFLPDLTFNFYV